MNNTDNLLSQLIKMVASIKADQEEMKADIQAIKEEQQVMKADIREMKADIQAIKEEQQEMSNKLVRNGKEFKQLQLEVVQGYNSLQAGLNHIWDITAKNENDIYSLKKK